MEGSGGRIGIQVLHGGLDIPVAKLESAFLAGANVQRVVLAAVTQTNRGEEIDFDALVAAELEGRWDQELGRF